MTHFKKSISGLIVISMLLTIFLSLPAFKANAAGTETPFYDWKQYDPQWKDVYIGSNTIGNIGCYATSAAILIVYGGLRTEADFDPATFVKELKKNGGFSDNLIFKGKINQAIPGFDYHREVLLGKTAAEKTETIADYLDKGYYIIAGVKNLGHYVAIREVKDGVVYMMDPASEVEVLFDRYAVSGVTKIFLYTSTGEKVTIGDSPIISTPTPAPTEFKTGIYKTTDRLNLRQSATTSSSVLEIIPEGAELTVKEIDGIWGKTSYNGKDGYVSLEYANLVTEIVYKDPSELSSEDASEEISEEPSMEESSEEVSEESSEEVSEELSEEVSKESSEEVSEELSEEVSKESSEEVSEESSEEVSEESSEEASTESPSERVPGRYVMTGNVYLRKGPNSSYGILTAIPKGTEIVVTEIVNNWGKTSYGDFIGYCGLSYSKLVEAFEETIEETPVFETTSGKNSWIVSPTDDEYKKGLYNVAESLNLRETPSTSSTRLEIMAAGTQLTVTEIKGNWGKVSFNGKTGWCSLEYCEYLSPYVEKTVLNANSIVGTLSNKADLSSLSINIYYSDGSVYSVKKGIGVSYTAPSKAGVINAKATHNGNEYEFKILYVNNCTVATVDGNAVIVVSSKETAKNIFGNENVSLEAGKKIKIDGIAFTTLVSGDVDNSGDISSTDYLIIKNIFLGTFTADGYQLLSADMNADGEVDSADYIMVKSVFSN